MKPSLNVFFAIGRYFIKYFTVSLTSLLETNQHIDLTIYLIFDFEDISLLDEVRAFAKSRYGITINLIFQDISIFKDYRIGKHVSVNTYLRLLLTNIIPEDVDSGLFLDSDTVVTGPLTELAEMKFAEITDVSKPESEKYIYAVSEIPEQRIANSNRLTSLGFKTDSYFNAGVMMISLKNWRLTDTSAALLNLANTYMEQLVFWDQDVLNMHFVNRWTKLDETYNALHLIWERPKTPLIVHYAGSSKPWNYLDRHPYKSCYFKYLELGPYREDKYVDFSFKKIPYKYYRDFRHFLNYYRQLLLGNIKR